jgi:hypothetical protein
MARDQFDKMNVWQLRDWARYRQSRSKALLACTEEMLAAAVKEAVLRKMFPVADAVDRVAENWANMRACIDAALAESNAGHDSFREGDSENVKGELNHLS